MEKLKVIRSVTPLPTRRKNGRTNKIYRRQPQVSPHFEEAQRNQQDSKFTKTLILLDKVQMMGYLRVSTTTSEQAPPPWSPRPRQFGARLVQLRLKPRLVGIKKRAPSVRA